MYLLVQYLFESALSMSSVAIHLSIFKMESQHFVAIKMDSLYIKEEILVAITFRLYFLSYF